ncbi:MAG: DUF4271 domain-containing protein [Chitinophagaceae bacterium]
MKRFLFSILILLLTSAGIIAQVPPDTLIVSNMDSTIKIHSLPQSDSVSRRQVIDSSWLVQQVSVSSPAFRWQVLKRSAYFDFKTRPITKEVSSIKTFKGKEFIFYLLIFLLIVFAVLRQLFPKYFSDLYMLFFRTTLKQTQIREQLMQTPLPSFMLNGFFVVSSGLYITFLLEYFKINPVDNFWRMFFYCCLGLFVAYLVKFLGLKIAGWLLGIKEATDAYIFIVFIVNKMIGIFLLPFLFLLAFTEGKMYSASLTISWCLLAVIYLYRFILTYSVIRNQIKVNPFHFFLYFCAFEIAPLLLIYRGLLVFFDVTA